MAIAGDVGFRVTVGDALACFSESASRVVLSLDPASVDAVVARAGDAGVPVAVIGDAGGDRLVAEGAFDVDLAEATRVWRGAIPDALGAPVEAG